MRGVRFVAALAVAVLLHAAGLRLAPSFSLAVDLFLVLLVLNGLDGNSTAGLLGAVVAGLVTDTLSGGPFGLYGLVDTIIGYGTAYAAQRLVIQRPPGVFLVFSLAAASQQVLLMALALWMLPDPEFPSYTWALAKVATTGVVGVALFLAHRRLTGRLDSWRRTRTSKIRFDR